jgi:4-hydroxy-2-oxoglutarate aldolase
MYNFPGVTGGIDMDSDLICDIAREAPNICGIKLTFVPRRDHVYFELIWLYSCGAVGKLTRVTALSSSPSFAEQYPRKDKTAPYAFFSLLWAKFELTDFIRIRFLVLDGFIDILYPSVVGAASGSITGLANIAPVCYSFSSPHHEADVVSNPDSSRMSAVVFGS